MKRFATLAACACALLAARAPAQEPAEETVTVPIPAVLGSNQITRIEEDWYGYIVNPDSTHGSPQIVNVLSPDGTSDGAFGLFEFNHGTGPEFFKGGVQTQAWNDRHLIGVANSKDHGMLHEERDQLLYTVVMEIKNGHIDFGLINGSSAAWGAFATQNEKLFVSQPTSLTRFTQYSPEHSVKQTFVNHGAHRVLVLFQRKVRYYDGANLALEDTTPRTCHRFQQQVQFVSIEDYEANIEFYNKKAKKSKNH